MEGTLRAGGDAPGLILIETLRWGGRRALRGPWHLRRMLAGAAALGWPVDEAALRRALGVSPSEGGGPARLRVTLDRSGTLRRETAPLPPPVPLWRVGLAEARLASGDPWLAVKSSRRTAYDAARAALPQGLDELIFRNERDEVCDGTITTLFFDRGHGLRTPPLASGLLPGCLRAEALALGLAEEETLLARDLPQVSLWLGNSLRGLSPARFIS